MTIAGSFQAKRRLKIKLAEIFDTISAYFRRAWFLNTMVPILVPKLLMVINSLKLYHYHELYTPPQFIFLFLDIF